MWFPRIARTFSGRGYFRDHFATERLLGALELITGVLLWVMASQTGYAAWMVLMIAGSIVRATTIFLGNALVATVGMAVLFWEDTVETGD